MRTCSRGSMRLLMSSVIEELIVIAERRPEPGWAPFRSRVGADQYRSLYDAISRHVAPNSRVLDWGAGLGHLSYALGRCGFRAVGFALEPCALAATADGKPFSFVRGGTGQPTALPFRDGAFDTVVSAGVLEHVHEVGGDEVLSLREIRRVLRPGGLFVCAHLPNDTSWIEHAAAHLGRYTHPKRFVVADISGLLVRADLTLLEKRRYGLLPRNCWARLPAAVRHSAALASAWNGADSLGASLLDHYCQNHLFIARKTGD